jgi:hypothetical protein
MKSLKVKLALVLLPGVWLISSLVVISGAGLLLYRPAPKHLPTVAGSYSLYLAQPRNPSTVSQAYTALDSRPAILDNYFTAQGAPLAGYGQNLVDAADKYGLDWRLVAAIAMQESNAGKAMPRDSYNAWGWSIYTGQNSGYYFNNWEEAIELVTKGLAVYRDKYGLKTPEEIMTRYTPDSLANGGSWAQGVRYFMDLFGNKYNQTAG